jgi:hypothetical protein
LAQYGQDVIIVHGAAPGVDKSFEGAAPGVDKSFEMACRGLGVQTE